MYCKNCGNEMNDNAAVCVKCGCEKGVGNSYCPNCSTETLPGAAICVNCGVNLNATEYVNPALQKSKIAAGLLGIFLGAFGVHNFYLGFKQKALVQVLVSVIGGIITCGIATTVISIWGLVEGIMILTGSINKDASGIPLKD